MVVPAAAAAVGAGSAVIAASVYEDPSHWDKIAKELRERWDSVIENYVMNNKVTEYLAGPEEANSSRKKWTIVGCVVGVAGLAAAAWYLSDEDRRQGAKEAATKAGVAAVNGTKTAAQQVATLTRKTSSHITKAIGSGVEKLRNLRQTDMAGSFELIEKDDTEDDDNGTA